ncbi:hypothetical protein [Candidatus Uabimicrobium sp. HlEnr_7]|uniref:hypothetical protein n=1 Tax=Candidatus Uabimicrobium helgolandensis TaxID=3095367 RepID=UPI003557A83C
MDDYYRFIQKNLRLPYVHHMIIADLQGNTIVKSTGSTEEEAAMSSFLHQSALQVGEEFGLSSFHKISFEYKTYKCIITEQRNILILVMIDKDISDSKYISYLEKTLS